LMFYDSRDQFLYIIITTAECTVDGGVYFTASTVCTFNLQEVHF
jgi:hypothetical protein